MKKLIVTLVLGFIFHASFSQSDYAITIKGDTLRGEIKIFSYDIVDRVQLTVDKKKKSYTALEVKEISQDHQIYRSVRYENRYKFMTLLKSGYLSLYGFRIEKQFAYDGRFLVKRDGAAMEVPNLTFKKSMQEFMQDCISVRDQLKSGELGRKNLDTLIALYNNCIEQNSKQVVQVIAPVTTAKTTVPELEMLRGKIEASALTSKQDVLDLIKDIDTKQKENQAIPNYLIEGLKGYLVNTEFKDDLEKLIEALKK